MKEYVSPLGAYETQKAIVLIKKLFQERLAEELNLRRVSAPLFVTAESGVNDDLSGNEKPISFNVPSVGEIQIVQSLAKWKRIALKRYDFHAGKGLYTDMNAIRPNEKPDRTHSYYVDQWDWEKVITREQRTVEYLKATVKGIVRAICDVQYAVFTIYPQLRYFISREVAFITGDELLAMYPDKTAKEREYLFVKEHKTAFIMQIGKKLKNGEPHDTRAADYDDWSLNGDIMVWNEVLGQPLELSSMGIRVDAESLRAQLAEAGHSDWESKTYHKMILNDELPLTIGGGIGQSRLCMQILNKAHVGEVQVSVWDEETIKQCEAEGIKLL